MPPDNIDAVEDPVASAQRVGLNYVNNQQPGIRRQRCGKGFCYIAPSGTPVRDRHTLRRIAALAIPPAWIEVWISTDPNGHLQATGRDDRRRKQFRYHPRWRGVRDETKFERMIAFARALPRIRSRVTRDLARPGLPRNKVLATVVRLLELSLIRVGNEEYFRQNDSFGLTTLQDRHVNVNGSKLRFRFRGKAGKQHEVDIHDPHLARIVKRCQDLPGQDLFQFVDDEGNVQDVRSTDVNEYLRDISGEAFTAKDFRTWAGTKLVASALQELEPFRTKAQARKHVATAIQSVAARLGNTPAVCRKCYVHPHVLDCYLEGALICGSSNGKRNAPPATRGLDPAESALLHLLEHRLSLEQRLVAAVKKEKRRTLR